MTGVLPINLGLVGLGYWGPNLLRAAADLEDVEVSVLCDVSEEALAAQARRYPHTRSTQYLDDVLEDDSVQAILVATPADTHYDIVRQCLLADKHVLVEKPFTARSSESDEIIEIALERGLTVMPGHIFLYAPPVVAISELLARNALGDIYFVTSTRVNLGIHRRDASVIQDLAPHDFSMIYYWFGMPTFIRAIARDSIIPGLWDVAFIDLGYGSSGILARIEVSWLAPTKLRRTVIAGRRAMVVYDDTSNEPVRIFDRGAELLQPQNFGEHRMTYRVGDVISPHIDAEEPLRVELADFVNSIRTGEQPRSHMRLGRDIVRMVEAAEESLRHNGAPVRVIVPPDERRRQPDRRAIFAGTPRFLGPIPPTDDEVRAQQLTGESTVTEQEEGAVP
jgi:predicted dehydrogenase